MVQFLIHLGYTMCVAALAIAVACLLCNGSKDDDDE